MMRRRKGGGIFEVPEYSESLSHDIELTTQFFLDLRGVGHFPAPQDSRLIADWCARGVPLETIMRGIHQGAQSRSEKGEFLRTLSSIRGVVEGQIQHYLNLNVGQSMRRSAASGAGAAKEEATSSEHGSTPEKAAEVLQNQRQFLRQHFDALKGLRGQALENGETNWVSLCDAIGHRLKEINPQRMESSAVISSIMGAGRAFYDGMVEILSPEARQALREEAEAQLEGWIRPMSEDAREETLKEYEIGILRERLSLFMPAHVFELWGS